MGNHCRFAVGPALLTALLTTGLSLASAFAEDGRQRPITAQAEAYDLSVPARDVLSATGRVVTLAQPRINPLSGEPDSGERGTWTRGIPPTDPLAMLSQNEAAGTPPLDLRFNGVANPFACGGCSPPDTNGDVGRKHYIQIVNATKVAIFNKSGALLKPPFDLGSLWPSGRCTNNAGDPVVVFDEIANRWLLSQFAFPSHLCFAISTTPNPLGAYHLYTFDVGEFPDYFKVGVWPNGYYVSANESTYTAYAFDRTKMLAGDNTASFIKFTGETNFLLPADVDGSALPTGGGLFYTFKDDEFHGGRDRLELFRLTPNFATGTGTFNRIKSIPVTPFTYTVCGFFNFDCIPQKDTIQRVDAVSEWPMHRFAYRRFGARQELVGNFTVGGGTGDAGAAIRWFELRNTGGGWTLFQEGTQDLGDGHDRFMGSIAMDKDGNIALGYSVSSSTLFPSIRYATRTPGDALGTMGSEMMLVRDTAAAPGDAPGTLSLERTLKRGQGSQTASNRWGDYSAMSVDPTTGCQFWYTNEYYSPSSASDWKTAVGAFTVPSCD
jgi:hypothetical protein